MIAFEATGGLRALQVIELAVPHNRRVHLCGPPKTDAIVALAVINGLLLLFGAAMSFLTRSVTEMFNESRQIAATIYNVLFTCFVVGIVGLLQSSPLPLLEVRTTHHLLPSLLLVGAVLMCLVGVTCICL